jgi:hypothetical protein
LSTHTTFVPINQRQEEPMPLHFTGRKTINDNFQHVLEAKDGDKHVVVLVSQEAIEDFGLDSVQDKAMEKYAAGAVDGEGRVKVLTADFSG